MAAAIFVAEAPEEVVAASVVVVVEAAAEGLAVVEGAAEGSRRIRRRRNRTSRGRSGAARRCLDTNARTLRASSGPPGKVAVAVMVGWAVAGCVG